MNNVPSEIADKAVEALQEFGKVLLTIIEKIKSAVVCAVKWITENIREYIIIYSNAPTKWRHMYRHSKKRRIRKKYGDLIFRNCLP